jgi:hypothetical protein
MRFVLGGYYQGRPVTVEWRDGGIICEDAVLYHDILLEAQFQEGSWCGHRGGGGGTGGTSDHLHNPYQANDIITSLISLTKLIVSDVPVIESDVISSDSNS